MTGTGEFELALLLSDVTSAAPPRPAETPPQVDLLTSLEDVRRATNRVAASTQRLMSIYTPSLEPDLYDQTEFLDILKRLVLARSYAKVRVLLGDASRLIRDTHRFVAMSRRLTSCIDIRVLGDEQPDPGPAYLIADDRAIVHRANASQWEGVADLDNPAVARVHLAAFDELWLANAPQDHAYRVARR